MKVCRFYLIPSRESLKVCFQKNYFIRMPKREELSHHIWVRPYLFTVSEESDEMTNTSCTV